MLKTKNIIITGLIIVSLGGLLKIMKFEYSNMIILLGIVIEFFSLIKFFKDKKEAFFPNKK